MKRMRIIGVCAMLLMCARFNAQDTFSIVAMDSATGEVGSAGASCVDLDFTLFTYDHFIGKLFPDQGAINTQASYLATNQNNATSRMNAGDTPQEIIDWLVDNDIDDTPEFRQYGIVALVDGSIETAAFTGTSTLNYKSHITGSNYAIQGNILSGQDVLDSMEARFTRQEGDLACKLMAALQGANMVGADSRCASNNSSSLFAYVKVAQPEDDFGDPSFVVSVRTNNNDSIEPIDSLQIKFDALHSCLIDTADSGTTTQINPPSKPLRFEVFPNPSKDIITVRRNASSTMEAEVSILSMEGNVLYVELFQSETIMDVSDLPTGSYIIRLSDHEHIHSERFIKE